MMGSIPQSPQSPTKMSARSRDTGFPAPFCGDRNTTLPHPDADTSPNACISADDVSVAKVLHRSRRSFLAKHKRTISYGKILPEMEMRYGNESAVAIEESDDGDSSSSPKENASAAAPVIDGRPSKDGGDSLVSATSLNHHEHNDEGDKLQPPEVQKRRSVLRKLRISK